MNRLQAKRNIVSALGKFQYGRLVTNARALLQVIGYESERVIDLEPNTVEGFMALFEQEADIHPQRALLADWESIDFLFQLTTEEITHLRSSGADDSTYESYVFFAVKLCESYYQLGQLAGITREINKLTPMPAIVLFQHGPTLTLSVINRRPHKRDESRDVLEKITLIKDVDFIEPHQAHVEILFNLSLSRLYRQYHFTNLIELHQAWQSTFAAFEPTELKPPQSTKSRYDRTKFATYEISQLFTHPYKCIREIYGCSYGYLFDVEDY